MNNIERQREKDYQKFMNDEFPDEEWTEHS
jgi:hypothetical protein